MPTFGWNTGHRFGSARVVLLHTVTANTILRGGVDATVCELVHPQLFDLGSNLSSESAISEYFFSSEFFLFSRSEEVLSARLLDVGTASPGQMACTQLLQVHAVTV